MIRVPARQEAREIERGHCIEACERPVEPVVAGHKITHHSSETQLCIQTGGAGWSQAVSNFGLFDGAGTVKEWAWNEQQLGVNRDVLGGAWNEPDHMFLEGEARSPLDRSPISASAWRSSQP